jgi:hypothetical protein
MSATDSHLAAHEQRVVKCSVGETTPKGDWHLIYQLGKGGNGVVFLVRQGSRLIKGQSACSVVYSGDAFSAAYAVGGSGRLLH